MLEYTSDKIYTEHTIQLRKNGDLTHFEANRTIFYKDLKLKLEEIAEKFKFYNILTSNC